MTRRLPHDSTAYTQGLLVSAGVLYESTGEYGRSEVRRVEIRSGRVLASVRLSPDRFGEGLAMLGGSLYQLTWQSHVGYVYDVSTLARTDSFTYSGEGWGLTSDGVSLIMSDGTATLRFLDPGTFRVTRQVTVLDKGSPLSQVNELEFVRGELFANVYQSDWIVRIDPTSGEIKQWIDLAALLPAKRRTSSTDVLNGIAYEEDTGLFLVTGKRWPLLYELRLKSYPGDSSPADTSRQQ